MLKGGLEVEEVVVKLVKTNEAVIAPAYQTQQAAGMDLQAYLDAAVTLGPLERAMIPTGLMIELPIGYEAQIRARSGLAIKNGITIINPVGTIDSDYRGEICVLLVNLSNEKFTIEPGMRVAQMVVAKYERVSWQEVDLLNNTERGSGGLGSTGV
jgi:dUTP pyrophosphatase